MNIPYLLQILNTDKLQELVANIDLPPLDMNLAIWEAIDAGDISVDENTGIVKALVEVQPSSDPDLKNKILRVIQHYAREETNITRGRLNTYVKDPISGTGYPYHEYIMAVQHLIDGDLVEEEVADIPGKNKSIITKKGKQKTKEIRPAHKFVFLGLKSNTDFNKDWNQKAVDKWIADIDAQMLK